MTAALVSAVSLDSEAKGTSRTSSPSAGLGQVPEHAGPEPSASYQSLATLYQAECRAREEAQRLAWELQEEYRAAVAEAEEERRQKESLLEALQRAQACYASLATLPAQLPRPWVSDTASQAGLREAPVPGSCTDAAAAGTARPAGSAQPASETTAEAKQPAGAALEHRTSCRSSTPPPQAVAREEGSEESVDPAEMELSWEQLRQAYFEAQALNGALQGDVERAQLERDAVLYRLDALEQSLTYQQLSTTPGSAAAEMPPRGLQASPVLKGLQQQQREQQEEAQQPAEDWQLQQQCTSPKQYYRLSMGPQYGPPGVAPSCMASSAGSLAASPTTTIGSNEAAVTPLDRLAPAAAADFGPAENLGGSPAAVWSAADVQQHQLLQDMPAQSEQRQQGRLGSSSPGGAVGAGPAAMMADLWRQVQELQAQSAVLFEELSASQTVAGQLQARVAEERQLRQALEGRLAAAQRESRQADRQRLQSELHIRELQDLVECAIEEAESSRGLLQKVTAEGSTSGPKLKLGEIWTQLMQAEQRATSAMRPSKSPKASDASGQKLYEVWNMLEESRGKDPQQGLRGDGDTVVKAARQSALRSRLAALNNKFSDSGSRTDSPTQRRAVSAAASPAALPAALPAVPAEAAMPAAAPDLASHSPGKVPARARSQLSRTPEPTRQWLQKDQQQVLQRQQQQQQSVLELERAPELASPLPPSPKIQLEKEDSASSTGGHSPAKAVLGLGPGLSPSRGAATNAPWASPHGKPAAHRSPLSPMSKGKATSAGDQAAASSAGSSPYAGSSSWPPTQLSPERSPAGSRASSKVSSTSMSDLSRQFDGAAAGSRSSWQAAKAEDSYGEHAGQGSSAYSGRKTGSEGWSQSLDGSSHPVRELLKRALEPCQASTSPSVTDEVPGGPPLMAPCWTPAGPGTAAAAAPAVPVALNPQPMVGGGNSHITATSGAAAGHVLVDRGVQTLEGEAWLWGPSSPEEAQGPHTTAESSSPLHLAAGRLSYQPANRAQAEGRRGPRVPLPYFHRDDTGLLPPRAQAAHWLARYWWVHWLLPPPLRLLCANLTLWLLRPFNLLLFNRLSAAAAASGTGLVGLALWLALLPMLRGQQGQHVRHSGWWLPRPLNRAKAVGELVLYGLSSRQRRPPSRQA